MPNNPSDDALLHAAATNRTATAISAARAGSAVWAATVSQRFGKLAELDFAFIDFGKLLRQRFNFRADFAKEVKPDRLPIEEMLYIDQRCFQVSFSQ